MKMRLLYFLMFALIIGSGVYWWRIISYGYHDPNAEITQSVQRVYQSEKHVVFAVVGEREGVKEEYEAFFSYLIENNALTGITSAEVIAYETPAEIARKMRQEKVDVFIGSSLYSVMIEDLAEAEICLDRSRSGMEVSHTEFFTSVTAGITSLEELVGGVVAFTEPGSNVSYQLPKAELLHLGFSFVDVSDGSRPGPFEIGYYFAGDIDQMVADVLSGKALAGAIGHNGFNRDYADVGELVSIHEGTDVYVQLVTFANHLDEEFKMDLKNQLISMAESDEGRSVLEKFQDTDYFSIPSHQEDLISGIEILSELIEEEILK